MGKVLGNYFNVIENYVTNTINYFYIYFASPRPKIYYLRYFLIIFLKQKFYSLKSNWNSSKYWKCKFPVGNFIKSFYMKILWYLVETALLSLNTFPWGKIFRFAEFKIFGRHECGSIWRADPFRITANDWCINWQPKCQNLEDWNLD